MKKWLLEQKYILDMGFQLWPLVNFALLIIATSDKLKSWLGLSSTLVLLVIAIPSAFVAVWAFGKVLDRNRYMEEYIEAQSRRNPNWEKSVEYFEAILREVKK